MLKRTISTFRKLRATEYSQLTIAQLDDLLWYADIVGDKCLLEEINEISQKSSQYRWYRNIHFEKNRLYAF